MKSRDFCYWLQGFFELRNNVEPFTMEQVHIIKQHLAMVFEYEIDPTFGSKGKQEILDAIHSSSGGADSPIMRC